MLHAQRNDVHAQRCTQFHGGAFRQASALGAMAEAATRALELALMYEASLALRAG
jgi:hypothetical protein